MYTITEKKESSPDELLLYFSCHFDELARRNLFQCSRFLIAFEM